MTENPLYVSTACCPVCGANIRNGDHAYNTQPCPMCAPQPDRDPDLELP